MAPSACPWSCPRALDESGSIECCTGTTSSTEALGELHLECLRLSDSGWRVSLVPAQCSSHALCDRATVSLFLRTPDWVLGAGSEKAENSTTSVTICPATMPKTFTGKPPIVAVGARVARVQRDSWDEALGPPTPVAGCAVARFAVPQDRYPKAILMPIRELMTSPSEKSPWRNRRSWTR